MKQQIRATTAFAILLLCAWVDGLGFERLATYALTYALAYAWCAYIWPVD